MPKPRIAAGELKWPIQILQPTLEQDTSGGVDPLATSVFASVWAKVEGLSGKDLYSAQQRNSEVTHRLTIYYIPGITSLMYVSFNDPGTGLPRLFQVLYPLNPDETPYMLWLYCVERADGARR